MTDPELLDNLEETARKAGAVVGVEKEQFLRLLALARKGIVPPFVSFADISDEPPEGGP